MSVSLKTINKVFGNEARKNAVIRRLSTNAMKGLGHLAAKDSSAGTWRKKEESK